MLQLIFPSLFLALRASAAAFTVLDVDSGSQARPSIVAVSPIGVGQNGATTYDVAKEVHTGGFNAFNGVTTFFGPPVTVHATVVANSEGSVVTEAPQVGQPFAQHVVCGFNRGVGACVSHLFDDGAQITVPFTGRVFPLFTVTVDDVPGRNAQPTQPPSPFTVTPGGTVPPANGSPNSPGMAAPGSAGASPNAPAGAAPGSPAGASSNAPGGVGLASSAAASPTTPFAESNDAAPTLHGSRIYLGMASAFTFYFFI